MTVVVIVPLKMFLGIEAAAFANQVSSEEGFPLCYTCEGSEQNTSCSIDSTYSTIYDCPRFRLPTEIEWEFSARAGQMLHFTRVMEEAI